MIGWVFFRADTLQHAAAYLGAMAGTTPPGIKPFDAAWFLTPKVVFAMLAGAIGSVPVVRGLSTAPALRVEGRGWMVEGATTAALAGVLAASILQIAGRSYDPFIYFRF
jgi:alginate O-acetyltransferase complex protein AlgI